jgi:hypothetical protein
MKIYIASSWKMEETVKKVATILCSWGHKVDCFCDESTGRYVFSFTEIKNHKELNAINFLKDKRARKAFKEDKKWIDWCDTLVMLLPCGNSSHLEAGYAKGQGKKLYIVGDFPVGYFDVMYGFADGMFKYNQLNKLKKELKK